jgi:hypothetical protein
VVDANDDSRKDLLVGRADGTLVLYLNVNTDDDPQFDGGTFLQVGEPGSKTNIDVGSRATGTVVDWNDDEKRDLVVGALDGMLRIYINEGTDGWDFRTVLYAQDDGFDLVVPTVRSSPHVADLDDDGKKDLLTGNTEGQLLLYSNVGSDETPTFSGYTLVEADSVPVDLSGSARSRPFVCDWNNDDILDVLIGGSDGLVHLCRGVDVYSGVSWDEQSAPFEVARLLAAYPNPFNPRVIIPFMLFERRHVQLSVYSPMGRRIVLLADRVYDEGQHRARWRGVDDEGREVPSGVYFVRLNANGISVTCKVVLLR